MKANTAKEPTSKTANTMHRPVFGNENPVHGDSFSNMVESPDESPERDPRVEREVGGRYNMMAQRHEEVSRSVRAL